MLLYVYVQYVCAAGGKIMCWRPLYATTTLASNTFHGVYKMPVLQEHLLELAWFSGFPMGEETASDCAYVCVFANSSLIWGQRRHLAPASFNADLLTSPHRVWMTEDCGYILDVAISCRCEVKLFLSQNQIPLFQDTNQVFNLKSLSGSCTV